MSGRIDHVAAAKDWIGNAVSAQASKQPNNEQLAAAYAGVAQVHATLALVEQQRIANRIALAEAAATAQRLAGFTGSAWGLIGTVGVFDNPETPDGSARLHADLAEGLGL